MPDPRHMELPEGHAYQAELLLLRFLEDFTLMVTPAPDRSNAMRARDRYVERKKRLIALLELGLAAEWCDACGGPKSDCGPHCKTKGDTP